MWKFKWRESSDPKTFDQNDFWVKRHQKLHGDPRSVGNTSKSLESNLEAETRIAKSASVIAETLKPYSSVLDIGCGYGRVAASFCDRGYSYTGVDVSPVAIEQAKEREPRGTYLAGSALDIDIDQTFDLIAILYVFVHFTDDDDWQRLIEKLVGRLNRGGGLLIADQFSETPERPNTHVRLRPLSMYSDLLAEFGLTIDQGFQSKLAKTAENSLNFSSYFLAK